MKTFKLAIAYDGTKYCGWQIQPKGISVQEIIEQTIRQVTNTAIKITGSGRTDAGVHAFGQIAHFRTEKPLEPIKFLKSLNSLLPKDIRITGVEQVPASFHARYSATAKKYRYVIYRNSVHCPFQRAYSWHVRESIDLQLLQQAAQFFIGTHNFSSFANEAHRGMAKKNPLRTIYSIAVQTPTPSQIVLEFLGNGFLYKMVRNLVSIMIEVALQKRELLDISRILAAKDRRLAPKPAPACGLFLVDVYYSKLPS